MLEPMEEFAIPLVLFAVKILIVMAILYIAVRLVTKEEVITGSYAIRLLILAVIAIFLVPLLRVAFSKMDTNLDLIGVLIAFAIFTVLVRYILVPEVSLGDEWVEAVIISLLTIVLIFLLNIALSYLGYTPLVESIIG